MLGFLFFGDHPCGSLGPLPLWTPIDLPLLLSGPPLWLPRATSLVDPYTFFRDHFCGFPFFAPLWASNLLCPQHGLPILCPPRGLSLLLPHAPILMPCEGLMLVTFPSPSPACAPLFHVLLLSVLIYTSTVFVARRTTYTYPLIAQFSAAVALLFDRLSFVFLRSMHHLLSCFSIEFYLLS